MEGEYTDVEREILQDLISSDIENNNDVVESVSTDSTRKSEKNDGMNDSIKKRIGQYAPIQKKPRTIVDSNIQPYYIPDTRHIKRGENTYKCKYCGELTKGHTCQAIIETCDESIQTESAQMLEDKIFILPTFQTITVKNNKAKDDSKGVSA